MFPWYHYDSDWGCLDRWISCVYNKLQLTTALSFSKGGFKSRLLICRKNVHNSAKHFNPTKLLNSPLHRRNMRHKIILLTGFSFLKSCFLISISGFLYPLGPLLWDHWDCFCGTDWSLFRPLQDPFGHWTSSLAAATFWPLQFFFPFWLLQHFFGHWFSFFGHCNISGHSSLYFFFVSFSTVDL